MSNMENMTAALTNTTQDVMTPEENATWLYLQSATHGIYASYIWVILLLGFPGNVACVVTVLSMTTLSTATLYVALLAVVDALTLVLKLVVHQIGYHNLYKGDHGCKAIQIANIFNCYANWMLVLVCFERFLAVRWPLKKVVFFTKSRACLIAGALFLIIFLIFSQLFFLQISDDTGYLCGTDSDFATYMHLWTWFSVILMSLAPFVLIVVFTVLIVTGLRKYRSARKSILGGDQNGKADKRVDNVERAISIMMSVAATVFLLLTLPNCCFFIFFDHWNVAAYPPVELARWRLFEQVGYMLADMNHAVNFYLYFLTADKFRTQFKDMVMCRRRGRKKSDVTSIGEHTMYTRANSSENIGMSRV